MTFVTNTLAIYGLTHSHFWLDCSHTEATPAEDEEAAVIHQDADLAEYIAARDRSELKRHPRSPIVTSPKVAKDIDLSGIFRMTADEIDAELRRIQAA